jgi:hypothetical protein
VQVGPRILVVIQLEKVEVAPTSGPTWRLSHLSKAHGEVRRAGVVQVEEENLGSSRIVASEVEAPNMLVNLV